MKGYALWVITNFIAAYTARPLGYFVRWCQKIIKKMKNIIFVILLLLSITGVSQDFKELPNVNLYNAENSSEITITFDRTFFANIILIDPNGEPSNHYVNYNTSDDLCIDMSYRGVGEFLIIIQYAEYISVKKVKVIGKSFETYTDQIKLILK